MQVAAIRVGHLIQLTIFVVGCASSCLSCEDFEQDEGTRP
jgi:hypothetical protein